MSFFNGILFIYFRTYVLMQDKTIKIIGITGGIGSGKSTVCKIFQTLGYRVYDADSRAKALLHENEELKRKIKAELGEEAYTKEGIYNRAYIGSLVFADKEKLAKLNAIVHPATRQDFQDWVQENQQNYPKSYLIKEAAILFESGSYKDSDLIISVYCPKNIRIQRVIARDKSEPRLVIQRIQNQWADSKKIHLSDFTIYNDGEHAIIPQVMDLVKKWESLSSTFV